jgi:hypothetical protein
VRWVSVFLVFCFGLAGQVFASTVDFAGFENGNRGPALSFENGLVVETTGGSIIVYGADDPVPGLCPFALNRTCRGELSIIFFGPVQGLAFTLDPSIPEDAVAVTLYDGETIVAKGAMGGSVNALPPNPALVTRARLSFAAVGLGGGGSGGSLRSIAYDTQAPGLSEIDVLLPDEDTPTGRPVQTEVLDFTLAEPLDGRRFPRSVRVPGATITVIDSNEIYVYGANAWGAFPSSGGVCAIAVPTVFKCVGDFLMAFDTLIRDLSFDALFYKPGDLALVRLFSGDTLITEREIDREGEVSFFGFAGISHIEILDLTRDQSRDGTGGFAYANFRYSIYDPTPIPLPASFLTLASGFVLLAGAGLRRSARTQGRRL